MRPPGVDLEGVQNVLSTSDSELVAQGVLAMN